MEWKLCSPKFYGPLTIWPWLRISPQSSLNVIYYLIISVWQWLMSFIYMPCIPMQIKPSKSPLRNRFQALFLWEIGHLSSPTRSCLGRLILIHGSLGGALPVEPPHRMWSMCVHIYLAIQLTVIEWPLYTPYVEDLIIHKARILLIYLAKEKRHITLLHEKTWGYKPY